MQKTEKNRHHVSAHLTHIGRVRERNEDAWAALPESGFWLVADGMGGAAGGDVASAVVAGHMSEQIAQGRSLEKALYNTHQAVIRAAREGRGSSRMGSTAVALKLEGPGYEIAWVGDSRAYLWDGRQLKPLTRDHSEVQRMLDQGLIDEREAAGHPDRHILSQCLGPGNHGPVHVDTVNGTIHEGEWFLLCSDGLTGELSDEAIAGILAGSEGIGEAVDRLCAQALDNGGHDNITLILVSAGCHPESNGHCHGPPFHPEA